LGQFDERTVFYDVFITVDGSKLIAIGPPFLNLGKFLNNLQLTVNGLNSKFKITRFYKGLVQLQAELKMPPKKNYDVSISFSDYSFSDFKMRKSKQCISAKKYSFNRKKVSANDMHRVKFSQIKAKLDPSKFVKDVEITDAYFLHYAAITTDWKSKTSDFDRSSRLTPYQDIENLVPDEYIQH